MSNRVSFLKMAVITLGIFLVGGSMSACSTKAEKPSKKTLASEDVTLITRALPQGEVAYALAVNLERTVDASKVDQDSLKVETLAKEKKIKRTITKVYSSNRIIADGEEKEGNYLIIELDPADSEASTVTFDPVEFLSTRKKLQYFITFNTELVTKDGTLVATPKQGVKNSKEVTPVVDDMEKLTFHSEDKTLNYRLFEPEVKENETYPLILFLHGAGERGTDNVLQVANNEGATAFANPIEQEKHPSYVLAPQSDSIDKLTFYWTEEDRYNLVLNLLEETIEKYSIDRDRIYLVGMSMGGVGTWNLLEKNPDLFAAAVPICGITNSKVLTDAYDQPLYAPVDPETVPILKNIPIWAFHGVDDPIVDVRNSREMNDAIKESGGTLMNYTELPEGTSHFSWIPALQNDEMKEWLFNQKN